MKVVLNMAMLKLFLGLRRFYLPPVRTVFNQGKAMSDMKEDDIECTYVALFEKSNIDGWEVRKAMCDLHGMDLIPSPMIIKAALKACRRCNDYALAIRFLEAVKFKCGPKEKTIWPYLLSETRSTMEELGIETPEQLGYHKPELALKSVFDHDYFSTDKKR